MQRVTKGRTVHTRAARKRRDVPVVVVAAVDLRGATRPSVAQFVVYAPAVVALAAMAASAARLELSDFGGERDATQRG